MIEKILIVEDEPKLATLLRRLYECIRFQSLYPVERIGVVTWVREHKPGLILLDVMLPGRDGMDICREIPVFFSCPHHHDHCPGREIDRVIGLELGADDYICKPFSPREVNARVKAVLRRTSDGQTMQVKGLVLDKLKYRATLHGHELELTAIEFKLLQYLVDHPGRIYERNQIMENIYQDDRFVSGPHSG